MTRVRVLALLVAMALLAVVPAVAAAQQVPPHVFTGTVTTEDGAAAADGTEVTAWIGGEQVGPTATISDGRYTIQIEQPEGESFAGETVSFRIGDASAAETGTWQQGGADILDLTAGEAGPPQGTPVEDALAALADILVIASAFDYATGQYMAYVPGQPENPLTQIMPNSVLVVTLSEDATVMVSGASFNIMADVPTPLPVGSDVSITVQ